MKKPDSRRNHAIALLCTGLTLAGCNSTAPSRNHIDKGADSSFFYQQNQQTECDPDVANEKN